MAPTLWIRLSEESVGFASGIMIADIDRWRTAVGDDTGAPLAASIAKLAQTVDLDVAGQALKKVPKPWPEDHPRGDLLRHKMFQVRWPEPTPTNITTAGFAEWCSDRLALVADVHYWLTGHMA